MADTKNSGAADESRTSLALASLRDEHAGGLLAVGPDDEIASAVACLRDGADHFLAASDRADPGALAAALLETSQQADRRRAAEDAMNALRASENRLRALCAYLQTTIESERKAIAREIHDDVGGLLTALRFDLEWIWRHAEKEIGRRALHALEGVAQAMSASQRISRHLRPPVLEAGVVAALEWQVEQFRQRTQLAVRFSSHAEELILDDVSAVTVYRCVQEALTNIVKHAQAQRVSVDLVARDGLLSVEISDDGAGLSGADLNKPGSFGIRGLAERAHAAGGWLDVSPSATGTTVLLTLPLTAPAAPTSDREQAA